MDVDGESDPSSGDDSDDNVNDKDSRQGPGQARFRKRKLARILGSGGGGGASSKCGKKADGGGGGKRPGSGGKAGGGAAAVDVVPVERLDWPSTIVPRTPYDVPLLLSCLSTYPDKASGVFSCRVLCCAVLCCACSRNPGIVIRSPPPRVD